MSFIVVAPSIGTYSEVWLKRQLLLMHEHIEAVIVNAKAGSVEGIDNDKIASYNPHYNLLYRIQYRLGVRNSKKKADGLLKASLIRKRSRAVLFHYIEFALQHRTVIMQLAKQKSFFVYCHGFDITWDLRKHEQPKVPKHPADYVENVQELSAHVCFIANSCATKQKLLSIGIPENKIKLVYFGVSAPDVKPEKPLKSQNPFIFLYIGRLVDFKGPDLVIRSFELACKKGMKHARLIMAGDGPLRLTCELLRAQSTYKDQIEILGAVAEEEVKRLMIHAHVFTAHNCKGWLTNQEEAYGVALVEAMAQGLPIVTGNSGGVAEIIADGTSGILVEPGDIEAHAAALYLLYTDTAMHAHMSKAAYQRVQDVFNPVNEKQQLLNALKDAE